MSKPGKLLILIIIFYTVSLITHQISIQQSAGKLTVKFFDVGQGDAILLTTPSKKRVLIDGGPNFDIDYYLLQEFPFAACSLDIVVLTHPHKDHLAGLNRVLKRCTVGLVLFNDVEYESLVYEEWLDTLSGENVGQVKPVYAEDEYELDGLLLKVLWPTEEYVAGRFDNVNNTSIVLLVDYGEHEIVLTGDAEREVQSQIDFGLLARLVDGNVEVLKVPHQGARDSLNESLISQLEPEYAVISVGENSFGHPHEEVLKYYDDLGAQVLRTDLKGTVEFVFK